MIVDIAGAQRSVVDRLAAAGVRGTADERDVNPPCVFVPVPALSFRFGGRCWDGTYALVCVVPDAGRPASVQALGDLIGQVQTALGGGCVDGAPVSFAGVDGAPPLPAFTLRYSEQYE
jgi:hypothetical protein